MNEFIDVNKPSTIFILVDENTNQDCLPYFLQELETNVTIEIIEIESGEEYKNLDTCTGLLNALTELGADRKSSINSSSLIELYLFFINS